MVCAFWPTTWPNTSNCDNEAEIGYIMGDLDCEVGGHSWRKQLSDFFNDNYLGLLYL